MTEPSGAIGRPGPSGSGRLLLGALAYVVFVVYGSLVPFDYRSMPVDEALAVFRQIPMLQLGVEQRADWIANGVLYVPVGFLCFAALHALGLGRVPGILGALLFGGALAVGVEFAQLFFPPRTVSRNDVIAEWIGTLLGIVVALRWNAWFGRLLTTLSGRLGQLVAPVLQAYAALYLAFSFFPFDFVLSSSELAAKLESTAWGWWVAGQSLERGIVVLAAKLLAEAVAVVPIGLMLGRWNESRARPSSRHSIILGALLGLFIETIQFFVYSGTSQGLSLATRAAGMFAGAVLWGWRGSLGGLRLADRGGRWSAALALPYLITLLAVNGWFDHAWQGLAFAAGSLATTRFVPFYYHYFTTEQAALVSLVSVALMYAPIGIAGWLRRWRPGGAALLAASLAVMVEAGKLFLDGLHADPTNLGIAALSAWATLRILDLAGGVKPSAVAMAEAAPADARPAGPWFAVIATVLLASWLAVDFPVGAPVLSVALLGYAALVWHRPHVIWVAVPAALPLLDLAPWSGRFYLDEFDYLVMVSLLMGYARTQPVPPGAGWDRGSKLVGVLLGLTFAIGTVRGLLPWQWPDASSFTSYYSPYNALRLAKGALWAFLLLALLPRFAADVRRLFAVGMVIGLAGTTSFVIWERIAFPGLLNFHDVYRVTGPFSQMHFGGADIEAFLTVATPFALLLLVEARAWWQRIALAIIVVTATYALMVTFSRAGYAAFAVALGISVLLLARKRLQHSVARWVVPVGAVIAALAIAVPIYSGTFAQERIGRSGTDLKARMAHWEDALAIRDGGLATTLFGMGLGRFPETHYWRSAERRAGGYMLVREGDNVFLRIGSGLPIYVDQIVATEPNRAYSLRFSIRGTTPGGGVSFALCEKWLLTSADCVSGSASVGQAGSWEQREMTLESGQVGAGGTLPRPVKLSFFNPSDAGVVDIDGVRLSDGHGAESIANGDFSRGTDRWFFSADNDLPWHVWSMPVAVLFDLGWFGLLVVFGALLFAIARSARSAWQGSGYAAATLASLLGIAVLAGVDTVIDVPRMLLLIVLALRIAGVSSVLSLASTKPLH